MQQNRGNAAFMTAVTENLHRYAGRLEPFSEQGTEGIVWCICDPSKSGYDSLTAIDNGDLLTVFDDAARTKILWEGRVQFDFNANMAPLPLGRGIEVQRINDNTVHGIQTAADPQAWLSMFEQHKPCILIKHGGHHPL
jgi:hypothetical protein